MSGIIWYGTYYDGVLRTYYYIRRPHTVYMMVRILFIKSNKVSMAVYRIWYTYRVDH